MVAEDCRCLGCECRRAFAMSLSADREIQNRVTAHSATLDWSNGQRRHLARITPQAERPTETPFEGSHQNGGKHNGSVEETQDGSTA